MAKIRVRARAVDMLGRQQIVGIPTAIHELFKNAHDAYAKHVAVDYFRGDNTFVLRDDGYGMTYEEFDNKWLTIGTESKFNGNILPVPYFLGENIERRPILGEKGIGRLAIATIGPQVLVLSRAIREDGLHDLVVSFIHWGLFEIPGIDIDMIDIPVEILPGGQLPDSDFTKVLRNRVLKNVETLSSRIPADLCEKIIADLNSFNLNPAEAEVTLGPPFLAGDGHGTHFYISPTDSILATDIDEQGETASPLKKTLLGFSNTMLPDHPDPPLLTSFHDHRIDGNIDELIGIDEFFTPDEFKEASDHHFTGRFNEYGQFEGYVNLYKQAPIKCQIVWPEAHGRKTECGPFEINLAYVQGDQKESRLPHSQWSNIVEKLNLIGGLYLYKDGIRILPYGNSDYDFLNIESRRSKAHKDWFFSYRRMFGVVVLKYNDNPNLIEKAGREGFRENKAYRQLKSILENFFKQLALDYFRKSSVYGEGYRAIKEQFVKDAELLRKKEEQKKHRKTEFIDKLNNFFKDINSGTANNLASELLNNILAKTVNIGQVKDSEEAARLLLQLESEFRLELSILRSKFIISKPRGVGLNKDLTSDWDSYQKNLEVIEKDVFFPLEKKVRCILDELVKSSGAALDRRKRIDQVLSEETYTRKREVTALSRKARADAKVLSDSVIRQTQQKLAALESVTTRIYAEFSQSETLELSDNELISLQQGFLDKISETADKESEELKATLFQIEALIDAITNNKILEDETAALESTLKRTTEELETYSDLAQIGTAIGIVHHELDGVIRGIRSNFRKLYPWAKVNNNLAIIYDDLKSSFDHLDTYLKLFTPLSRRLNRDKIDLSGEYIRKYLIDIFDSRIRRHNINLNITEQFKAKTVIAYPSTLLPAFVNIIDNGIYWLTTVKDGLRNLVLDADTNGFLISNNGPGIEIRHAERIFEYGITLKEGGRGMGLYISRETLQKDDFDLILENPGKNNCPIFRIVTNKANTIDQVEI